MFSHLKTRPVGKPQPPKPPVQRVRRYDETTHYIDGHDAMLREFMGGRS